MLSGKVLNSGATTNNFVEIGSLEFISGEELTVVIRIHDPELDLRYIPPTTNITTFTLNKPDGTDLEKTGTMDTDDRSIIRFTLSETETADLLGGNIKYSLDILGDGTQIKKGVVQNALARFIDGC